MIYSRNPVKNTNNISIFSYFSIPWTSHGMTTKNNNQEKNMNQLPIMAKQAAEIAHNTQELSDKLKDLVIDTSWQTNTSTIDPLVFAITIFVLASFVGYYVV